MLKSFPARKEAEYRTEIKAYAAFENAPVRCKNIVRSLGCYQVASPGDNVLMYTIMMESANKGTLLDLYRQNHPPVTIEETKAFWAGFCGVVEGLEVMHHTPSDGVAGTSWSVSWSTYLST